MDFQWASLGVGGVIAGVIFFFYRQDRNSSEARYTALAQDFRKIVQDNTSAVTANTEVIHALKDMVELRTRNKS